MVVQKSTESSSTASSPVGQTLQRSVHITSVSEVSESSQSCWTLVVD